MSRITISEFLSAPSFDYTNPLLLKSGDPIVFMHEPAFEKIEFISEKTLNYYQNSTYKDPPLTMHVDYYLKGRGTIHIKLRLKIQKNNWSSQVFHFQKINLTEKDISEEFTISHDDEGRKLKFPNRYWADEDYDFPVHCKFSVVNKNSIAFGHKVCCWNFSRLTDDEFGNEISEYLIVEKVDDEQFYLLRGYDVDPSKIILVKK